MASTRAFILWKTLQSEKGVGPARLARIAQRLAAEGMTLEEVLKKENSPLAILNDSQIALLRRQGEDGPELQLPPHAQVVTPEDELYPMHRLDQKLPLPPILYVIGNAHLMSEMSVAVSGSRQASDEAIQYTLQLARILAGHGLNVVSGNAAGIDEAAHASSLRHGGTTTIVAAEGIAEFKPKKSLNLSDPHSFAIVSEFDPDARWTSFRAMQRNTTIAALADVVVVVVAGIKGGAWAQGQLCLNAGKRLLVPDVPTSVAEGNQRLIEAGATAVDPLNPEDVLRYLEDETSPSSEQLRFTS